LLIGKYKERIFDKKSYTRIPRKYSKISAHLFVSGLLLMTFSSFINSSSKSTAVSGNLKLVVQSSPKVVPSNFSGLSYELAQLKDPKFFSASNKELVKLFKILSPNGVLRLGGNSSESCWLKVDPTTTAPQMTVPDMDAADHWMPRELFMIPSESIDSLAGFLEATGWELIYGFNFGHSSPERLANEANYIAKRVQNHLLYFQIGNEPDFYSMANNRTRPNGWSFNEYIKEWTACTEQISSLIPNAKFGGPDVGASSNWIKQFIPIASKNLETRLVAVTGHYYASGPPDNPNVTTENLLKTKPDIRQRAKEISDLAASKNLYYRMTEGNSCYRGGKPGMSNTLASALWGGDYMLSLATAGCGGVNLHGGSRNMLRAALGNHLPGEKVETKDNETSGGYYTAIAGEVESGFTARPLFYGMLLANQFAGSEMMDVVLDVSTINVTAYACKVKDEWRIAIFNKDLSKDLDLTIELPIPCDEVKVWRLSGENINATENVSFANSVIGSKFTWAPKTNEKCKIKNKQCHLHVPNSSAALLFLK
jgi:hypothetical protein